MEEFRIQRIGTGWRWAWYGAKGRLLAIGAAFDTQAEAEADLEAGRQQRPPSPPSKPTPQGRKYAPIRRH